MRIIPTGLHSMLDYAIGVQLMVSPWSFGFASDGAETIVLLAVGQLIILYSLFTDYNISLFNSISLKNHLLLDFVAGTFLIASPWIFGFKEIIYLPHLIIGIISIFLSLLTISYHREEVRQAAHNMSISSKEKDLSHG